MKNDKHDDLPDDPTSRVPEPLEAGLAAGFGPAGRTEDPAPSVLDLIANASGVRPRVTLREEQVDAPAKVLKPLGPSAAAWPAQQGKYQVQGEIARGGVGVVLKGHDIDLGRDVAMKVLHEKYVGNPDLMQRFVEEAQIGGQLQHPGIVPVYDLGLNDDRPYFTMKLIKGRTLAALFDERGGPGAERRQLLGVFEQVCQTMAYAHARGVIHRDLKPANVMVGAFGEVQIVDWGMGKVLSSGGTADEERAEKSVQSVIETVRSQPGSGSTHSIVGSVMGTPAYMPPEQANGDVEHMDERSDVFALGAILCEILTGAPPYVGELDERIVMAAKAQLDPCKQRIAECDADEELRELCRDCLMPAPPTRPRNAGRVAERIDAYLASLEDRARSAQIEAAEERVRSGAARRSARLTLALAASVLATLIVAGGGAWWMQNEKQARRTEAAARVTHALEEVGGLLAAARAGGAHDLVPWGRVATAAKSMLDLAALDDVPAERLEAARAMHVRATSERERAEREAGDRVRGARLLERLGRVRVPPDEGIREDDWPLLDAQRQDKEYAAAFSEYFDGRPIEDLATDGVVVALSRDELKGPVVAALDHWALLRGALNVWDSPLNMYATGFLGQIADSIGEEPWRSDLRGLLPNVSRQRTAIERLASQMRIEDLSADGIALLGEALWTAGSHEQAVEALRRGRQLHPSDFGICMRLAIHLWRSDVQPFEEIVDVLYVANALQPAMEEVLHLRGMGLHELGRYEEERRLWEDLVANEPDAVHWLMHLGFALGALGDLEARADVERRRFKHSNSGDDQPDGNRGASACAKLGSALLELGRYEEALESFRTGFELAERRRQSAGSSVNTNTLRFGRICANGMAAAQAILAELPVLEEVLRGDRVPDNVNEGLRAAEVALQRQQYSLAAILYRDARSAGPMQALSDGDRLNAICAAALCGTGRGLDADAVDKAQRKQWREHAAAWLREELELQLERSGADALVLADQLQMWQRDPDLAGLRDETKLAELPLAQRAAWRGLWGDISVWEVTMRDEAAAAK